MSKPNFQWIWRMAYRETRGHRRRLLLFFSAIAVGVAVIVAIQSFAENVKDAIDSQSRKLLGADLVVSSRSPFPRELQRVMSTLLIGESTREVRFSTMAYFPKNQGSRLVQIRAMEGNFPYYGRTETMPDSAMDKLKESLPQAVVEDSLLHQFNINLGDAIKIGEVTFTVVGRLKKIPGENLVISQLAPRVLIPLAYLDKTKLIQFGSRVFYRNSYKFFNQLDEDLLFARLKRLSDSHGISVQTVESRKESLGRTLGNLFHYLNLVGLAALILGGIGVGSAMHVYISRKLSTIATLRCLGAKGFQTLILYITQTFLLGIVGGIAGGILGVGIQRLLPIVLHGVLPIHISVAMSWSSIGLGLVVGVITTLVFSLSPLIAVRNISPALTLRIHYQPSSKKGFSPIVIGLMVAVLIIIYSMATAQHWKFGLAFSGAVILSFILMLIIAKMVTILLKAGIPSRLPYVIRQGLSNLHRPQNQTLILIVCLGIGTFLIMTLISSKYQLLHQIKRSERADSPNMVLFDIQTDQRNQVKTTLDKFELPIIQEVPILSMRISNINGKSVDRLRQENRAHQEKEHIPMWTLNREYRSTYRDHLVDSEKLVAGEFIGQTSSEISPIPISIEQGIAEDLQVDLGDTIVFDVQGIPIETTITSIRKVDWYKIQPNFFMVFPKGILEEAPQMFVIVTRVKDSQQSAMIQRETVKQFPNVSSIDLTLVLDTLTDILDNMSFAIEFMAAFSLITGFIVLISSIQINYLQRLKENVLLKILGASKRQIIGIMLTEYFTLGFLAVNTGILLAICGSLALSFFVFDTEFSIDWLSISLANITIIGLTMMIGMANSVSLYKRQPLEVLRQEIV